MDAINAINAMKEVRMWLKYGDYVAIHCEVLSQGEMRDLLWKTPEGCGGRRFHDD